MLSNLHATSSPTLKTSPRLCSTSAPLSPPSPLPLAARSSLADIVPVAAADEAAALRALSCLLSGVREPGESEIGITATSSGPGGRCSFELGDTAISSDYKKEENREPSLNTKQALKGFSRFYRISEYGGSEDSSTEAGAQEKNAQSCIKARTAGPIRP